MVKYLMFSFIFVLGFCGSASAPNYPKIIPPISNYTSTTSVSVLNFWATWCAACKIELKEFDNKFSGKGINLILVNLDSDPALASRWLKENYKGNYSLVSDSDYKIADYFHLTSFPTTFIIDKQSKIVYEQSGYQKGSTEKLVEALDRF